MQSQQIGKERKQKASRHAENEKNLEHHVEPKKIYTSLRYVSWMSLFHIEQIEVWVDTYFLQHGTNFLTFDNLEKSPSWGRFKQRIKAGGAHLHSLSQRITKWLPRYVHLRLFVFWAKMIDGAIRDTTSLQATQGRMDKANVLPEVHKLTQMFLRFHFLHLF